MSIPVTGKPAGAGHASTPVGALLELTRVPRPVAC